MYLFIFLAEDGKLLFCKNRWGSPSTEASRMTTILRNGILYPSVLKWTIWSMQILEKNNQTGHHLQAGLTSNYQMDRTHNKLFLVCCCVCTSWMISYHMTCACMKSVSNCFQRNKGILYGWYMYFTVYV